MAQKKEPTQRQLRVNEAIRHIIAAQLMRGDVMVDERLRGQSVTVTEVEVGPDMRHATAFVTPLGGGAVTKDVLDALNDAAPQFTHAVAKDLVMKYTPRIRFAYDERFDYADKINVLLKNADKTNN
ncbi:MAG TPA: 30S ribosome-binding factor RbfA [Alphaproteobacteria bacterium]